MAFPRETMLQSWCGYAIPAAVAGLRRRLRNGRKLNDHDADVDLFHKAAASRALLAAVTDLAVKSGIPLKRQEGRPLLELYRSAEALYGDELPDFWRIWGEWQEPPDLSTMGEL